LSSVTIHFAFAAMAQSTNLLSSLSASIKAKVYCTEDVLKHIDSTPEDKYYTLLPEFWEDEEQ
jgi:hypothetical protein